MEQIATNPELIKAIIVMDVKMETHPGLTLNHHGSKVHKVRVVQVQFTLSRNKAQLVINLKR